MDTTMKPTFPVLCVLTLMAAFAGAQDTPPIPTITAVLDGPRAAVFETPKESCAPDDIPDAMARAFRDDKGTVHFFAASSHLFASLGPDLDNLKHNCDAAYNSANDPNPAHFNDQSWLDSFYTFDGITIAALAHTEYHGWAHPGECNSTNINECEYDSDTFHLSTDGGYHFNSFSSPYNFLAGIPYKYTVDAGPMGYSVDTNIVEFDGWYYAVATSWTWPPNCSGTKGPNRCITSGGAPIRTHDVFDPNSWRTWNGTDFGMSFVDPYPGPVNHPLQHVYTPVQYMFAVNGIYVYEPTHVVVAVLWDYWDNELGAPGLYFTTSRDLIHWTKPALVVTVADLLKNDPKGSWLYAYFSLVDPDAPDLNFSRVGDHPYLYYVRLNLNGQGRVVFRQRLSLIGNP